jgi:type IV pilus assembly protein PilF
MISIRGFTAEGLVARGRAAVAAVVFCVACASPVVAQTRTDNVGSAARFNAQLAIEYVRQNNLAAAQEKIDKALQQNDRDASVQTAAAFVYERLRELKRADGHYARALRLDPKNPEMQNNYAVFLCRTGEHAKGAKLFEQAATNPLYRTPEVAYTNAGVCARSAKNLAAAEQNFRKALQVKPENADALLQLADLTFARGNGLQARAFLQRYFQAGQATPDALLLGVRVERSLGDTDTANDYASKLRRQFPGTEQARQIGDAAKGG